MNSVISNFILATVQIVKKFLVFINSNDIYCFRECTYIFVSKN